MNHVHGAEVFWNLAASLVPSLSSNVSARTKGRRFRALFGVSAVTCSRVWHHVKPSLPGCASPKHLLWTLYFLKQYGHEEANANFAGCDEKTFRKWCWLVIKTIADLDLVSAMPCE
jgi:hypothetical protein